MELQNVNYQNLHKRAPKYVHVLSEYFSESGENYLDLSNIIVIFICNFDPYSDGFHRYDFLYTCQQNKNLTLGDGSEIIFFNTKASDKADDYDTKKLLDYFAGKYDETNSTRLIDKMQKRVNKTLRNEDWEEEYMNYTYDLQARERFGIQKGEQIGRQEGEKIGILKGEQIGIQKGEVNKNNQFIKKMYGKYDINEIAELTELSISEVEYIAKNLGLKE